MSSTKQSNSRLSEDDSEQDKIDTSAETGPCERSNEADKRSQSVPLGFTKFVHGVDPYHNIVDQKSKWIVNLNAMFEDVIVKKLGEENTDIKGFINFKNPNLSKSNESEYQNEFLQTSELITNDNSFENEYIRENKRI